LESETGRVSKLEPETGRVSKLEPDLFKIQNPNHVHMGALKTEISTLNEKLRVVAHKEASLTAEHFSRKII